MFYLKKTKSTGRYELNILGLKFKFRLGQKNDTLYKEKLENLENYDDTEIKQSIEEVTIKNSEQDNSISKMQEDLENLKNIINTISVVSQKGEDITLNNTVKDVQFRKFAIYGNVKRDGEANLENSVKINGIPDLEYKAKTQNIFMDILDEMLTNERTSIKDVEERFIATVACKAAVKANMDLSKQEVENLIQSLLSLNNPYTCPHGRPTTIKISKEYLEEHL